MKVVLDTNVVMSAIFFGGDPKRIVREAISKRLEIVATRAVLSEYREVAEGCMSITRQSYTSDNWR